MTFPTFYLSIEVPEILQGENRGRSRSSPNVLFDASVELASESPSLPSWENSEEYDLEDSFDL